MAWMWHEPLFAFNGIGDERESQIAGLVHNATRLRRLAPENRIGKANNTSTNVSLTNVLTIIKAKLEFGFSGVVASAVAHGER